MELQKWYQFASKLGQENCREKQAKENLEGKCKILPTILGAAVALRCKRCSIFISVTEFRDFAFSQAFSPSTRILEGKASNLLKAKQIWNWKSSSFEKAVLYFGIIKNTNSKLNTSPVESFLTSKASIQIRWQIKETDFHHKWILRSTWFAAVKQSVGHIDRNWKRWQACVDSTSVCRISICANLLKSDAAHCTSSLHWENKHTVDVPNCKWIMSTLQKRNSKSFPCPNVQWFSILTFQRSLWMQATWKGDTVTSPFAAIQASTLLPASLSSEFVYNYFQLLQRFREALKTVFF